VAAQRLKNLMINARRNSKWQVSEERKQLCSYNLYLTNAPQTVLPAEECRAIYQLRWQIEILFKIWKSMYGVDKVKKMSIFRIECHLFGKLIALLLSQHIHRLFRNYIWKMEAVEMSEWKSMKIMKRNWQRLRDSLLVGRNSVREWFCTIFTMLFYTGRKESKKIGKNSYRKSPLHKLDALA
jgi:transposase